MLSKIKIVRQPKGSAPPEVRDAWIGMELPCVYIYNKPSEKVTIVDAVSRNIVREFEPGYAVPQLYALLLLAEKNRVALQWWLNNGYPDGDLFFFDTGCAESLCEIPTRDEFISIRQN